VYGCYDAAAIPSPKQRGNGVRNGKEPGDDLDDLMKQRMQWTRVVSITQSTDEEVNDKSGS
jgi:hypothetical protein